MSHILTDARSEVNAPGWTYRTLRPPRLTIANICRDLLWHARLYRAASLPLRVRLAFLLLRICQRVFYNRGWKRGGELS